MYALRSKNADGFRRSGVFFEAGQWTLLDAPTEAQLREAALEVIENVNDGDPRLGQFPIAGEEPIASPSFESLADEHARLKAENDALHDLIGQGEACVSNLTAQLAPLLKTNERLEGELAECHQQIAVYEGEGRQFDAVIRENDALRNDLAEAKALLNQQENRISEAAKDADALPAKPKPARAQATKPDAQQEE